MYSAIVLVGGSNGADGTSAMADHMADHASDHAGLGGRASRVTLSLVVRGRSTRGMLPGDVFEPTGGLPT